MCASTDGKGVALLTKVGVVHDLVNL
jgi:hypothetical protein